MINYNLIKPHKMYLIKKIRGDQLISDMYDISQFIIVKKVSTK